MTNTTSSRSLPPGIYCPSVSFFRDTPEQELDLETYTRHVEVLVRSGIKGIVVLGSTAEAVALTSEESSQLIRTAKETFSSGIVIAGTAAAQSTREAIERSVAAERAGADFVLVLPPSYYAGAITPAAVEGFYTDVADASPVPVIIYSYPGVSAGITMDTDLILRLAKHPNIAGIKHTDHEVGRIAREVSGKASCGGSDYLLGTLAVGGEGAITGMANIAPAALQKVYELHTCGDHASALQLAGVISRAEWTLGKGGILGTKYATQWANGYPESAALGRKPLPKVSDVTKAHVEKELAEVIAIERQLVKSSKVNGNGA